MLGVVEGARVVASLLPQVSQAVMVVGLAGVVAGLGGPVEGVGQLGVGVVKAP